MTQGTPLLVRNRSACRAARGLAAAAGGFALGGEVLQHARQFLVGEPFGAVDARERQVEERDLEQQAVLLGHAEREEAVRERVAEGPRGGRLPEVGVDHDDAVAEPRERDGQVGAAQALADASLAAPHRDDARLRRPVLRRHCSVLFAAGRVLPAPAGSARRCARHAGHSVKVNSSTNSLQLHGPLFRGLP